MKTLYVIYYENDKNVYYIPKDKEMTALQYIVLRYIQKGEIPVLAENTQGDVLAPVLGKEVLEELKLWYYSLHPKHRRENQRTAAWQELQQKVERPLKSEVFALVS